MGSIVSRLAESPGELLLIFGVLFVATYFLIRRLGDTYSGRKLPPAIPSLPIVGSIPFLPAKMQDLAEFCISPSNKLGKIFSLRLGSKYVVIICGQKAIREALVSKSLDFADRPELFIQPSDKGIAFHRYNSSFKSHHKLCLSIMKRFGFGHSMMETRILMELEEMIKKLREQQGRPFDVRQLTFMCVANVIMSMLFGRRFDYSDPTLQQLTSDISDFIDNISHALETFPVLRFVPHFKKIMAKCRSAMDAIFGFINNNVAACTQNEPTIESFVNYYIEAQGPEYDQEQLRWTLRDMIVGGTDTTASFLRWAIVLLTNHVSVQERLHSEIDSVIGRQRLPTLDDRSNLPYVEATILELLRYKIVIPMSMLHRALKDTEVGGYFIPGKTTVVVNLHSAHMDPDDWQQPQHFRPERFLNESGNVIDRDRVMAFSLGKRSCCGEQLARQEIFLFLVSMLQNFNFKPPEGHDSIDVHEEWGAGSVNQPSDYKVRLIAREA